jgi:hypothetical protein
MRNAYSGFSVERYVQIYQTEVITYAIACRSVSNYVKLFLIICIVVLMSSVLIVHSLSTYRFDDS